MDGVVDKLSRIQGLLDSVGPANDTVPQHVLLLQRSKQAREDIGKVMSEVTRIKVKAVRGKLKAQPGTVSGARAKTQVFKGSAVQTASGQKKHDFQKNKKGKVVSKKASLAGQQKFEHIRKWTQAIQTAKSELAIVGFRPVGGKTKRGKQVHKKGREVLRRRA